MCRKKLSYEYNDFITFLKKNDFINKREKENLFYKNNNILIKINDINIDIEDINEYRRYNFPTDTSNSFLINFITYLNNVYQKEIK